MNPADRKYSDQHEWIQVEEEVATVGITDFAQKELGDIVYVELPEEGREVAKGDVIGTIESVKAVSDIYAPVSGKIAGVNSDLEEHPEKVNGEPFAAGWYCKIAMSDSGELEGLMDSAAYDSFTD